VPPASVGFDPAKLDQIAQTAKKGKSNCLVVVRDGKVAGQWYFNGTGPNTTQNVSTLSTCMAPRVIASTLRNSDGRRGSRAPSWSSPG
jgi:hypothetical protein